MKLVSEKKTNPEGAAACKGGKVLGRFNKNAKKKPRTRKKKGASFRRRMKDFPIKKIRGVKGETKIRCEGRTGGWDARRQWERDWARVK